MMVKAQYNAASLKVITMLSNSFDEQKQGFSSWNPSSVDQPEHDSSLHYSAQVAERKLIDSKVQRYSIIQAPCSGQLRELNELDDPVFASEMLGPGLAIMPTSQEICAPCRAKITVCTPTNHAVALQDSFGNEILLHIGLDTVKLQGRGFTCFVNEGQQVFPGDLLLSFQPEIIQEAGLDMSVVLVITNAQEQQREVIQILNQETLQVGQDILRIQPQ